MTLVSKIKSQGFGWFLLLASLVGWIASGALVLERLALYKDPNHVASCDVNTFISCTSVMQSPQAGLLGFPNPFLGIVAFAITGVLGALIVSKVQIPKWMLITLQIGLTAALILVSWFWSQSVYVITALCPYCMIVWSMVIPMFIYTTLYNIKHGILFPKTTNAGIASLYGWAWVVLVLMYIGILGSIFFRFMSYFVK